MTMEVLTRHFRRASDVVAENIRAFTDIEAARRKKKRSRRVRFSLDVCLHQVVGQGDQKEMKALLKEHGPQLLNKLDSNGLPLGVRAAFAGQFDMLRLLVEEGYELSQADENGWTALHAAVATNDIAGAAFILLQPGAHKLTSLKLVTGERPIDVCESAEMASLILQADIAHFTEELYQEDASTTSLERPSEEQALVNYVKNQQGSSAQLSQVCSALFHVSAVKNYTKLAYNLLNRNLVDINTLDQNGWSALHTAAYYGSLDMVFLLLQCGIEVTESPVHPSRMTKNALIVDAIQNRDLL